MKAQDIFISGIIALICFNIVYFFQNPSSVWELTIGTIFGFIGAVTTFVVIGGIDFFGTGLDTASVKILFSVAMIFMLIYRIEIPIITEFWESQGFPMVYGAGLGSNLIDSFSGGTGLMGTLGVILSSVFCLMLTVSGIIMIVGGTGD